MGCKQQNPCNSARIKHWALRSYLKGDMLVRDIALRAGVSIATVSLWAKFAGILSRGRGRRELLVPNFKQSQILEALMSNTYASVGRKFGMTRAQAWAIANRWGRVEEIRLAHCAKRSALPIKTSHLQADRSTREHILVFRLSEDDVTRLKETLGRIGLDKATSLNIGARTVLLQACARANQANTPTHLTGMSVVGNNVKMEAVI